MASAAGIPILDADIEQRVAFAESMTMGQTIFEWAPGSPADAEISRLSLEIMHHGHENVLPGPEAQGTGG
jgi:chromosome partitioning protein